ncbi:hypothetical protein F4775DRAFT_573724, partial [Biscogniauxia sp. FL1348]
MHILLFLLFAFCFLVFLFLIPPILRLLFFSPLFPSPAFPFAEVKLRKGAPGRHINMGGAIAVGSPLLTLCTRTVSLSGLRKPMLPSPVCGVGGL